VVWNEERRLGGRFGDKKGQRDCSRALSPVAEGGAKSLLDRQLGSRVEDQYSEIAL